MLDVVAQRAPLLKRNVEAAEGRRQRPLFLLSDLARAAITGEAAARRLRLSTRPGCDRARRGRT
jgi:hypothetical protein